MSIFSNSRDLAQRSFGCISFSVLAHAGALTALILLPQTKLASKSDSEPATALIEASAASNESPASELPSRHSTHEVILSDASDASAVALPPAKVAKSVPKKTAVKKSAPVKVAALVMQKESDVALPEVVKTEEAGPTEEFQPNAIADVEEKNPDVPENLSPVISDDVADFEAPTEEPLPAPVIAKTPVETLPAPAPAALPPGPPTTGPAMAAKSSGLASGGSAVNGVPTGGNGYGQQSGPLIVDASLRKPLNKPQPSYSHQDRVLNREGLVVVVARVRADGSVDDVRIDKSTGSNDMNRSAVEAFKKWKFAPGQEVLVRNPFKFVLKGDSQVDYAKLRR